MDVSGNFLCGWSMPDMYLLPVAALSITSSFNFINDEQKIQNISVWLSLRLSVGWISSCDKVDAPYRTASSVGIVYVNNDTVVIDGDTLGFSSWQFSR